MPAPWFRSPFPTTKLRADLIDFAPIDIVVLGTGGSSSVVECFLAKEDVAGSNPVSRSNKVPPLLSTPNSIRRGTQVVRERSAKPLCVGSIPTRASKLLDNYSVVSSKALLSPPPKLLPSTIWAAGRRAQDNQSNECSVAGLPHREAVSVATPSGRPVAAPGILKSIQ